MREHCGTGRLSMEHSIDVVINNKLRSTRSQSISVQISPIVPCRRIREPCLPRLRHSRDYPTFDISAASGTMSIVPTRLPNDKEKVTEGYYNQDVGQSTTVIVEPSGV